MAKMAEARINPAFISPPLAGSSGYEKNGIGDHPNGLLNCVLLILRRLESPGSSQWRTNNFPARRSATIRFRQVRAALPSVAPPTFFRTVAPSQLRLKQRHKMVEEFPGPIPPLERLRREPPGLAFVRLKTLRQLRREFPVQHI